MSLDLTVYYPSLSTSYFATGGWGSTPKVRNCIFKKDENKSVIYTGTIPSEDKLRLLTLFQPEQKNESDIPSQETTSYWIRAGLTDKTVERLPNITCNSGKFLVFIPFKFAKDKDFTWAEFKKVYSTGALGYAVQCSTARASSNDNNTSKGLITVHTEDAFDLEQITAVAHAIMQTLLSIDSNYEGTLKYLTDRSTRMKCKDVCHPEAFALYSIDSSAFKQSLENFQISLYPLLTASAQTRQNLLKNKMWKVEKN